MKGQTAWLRRVSIGVTVAGVVLVWTRATRADTAESDVGKGLYLKYCSACHGPTGKGDGVVSGFMQPKATDLTILSRENGGAFPYNKVMASIRGTSGIKAHGDPDMPVWGETFRYDPSALFNRRVAIEGKIMLLADYLRSIQRK